MVSSQVSFILTGYSLRRRRSLRADSFQDYKDLALASGGQAIQVSKAELPQATDVILDTSTSALVPPSSQRSAQRGLPELSFGSVEVLIGWFIVGDCSAAGEELWGGGNLPLCVG